MKCSGVSINGPEQSPVKEVRSQQVQMDTSLTRSPQRLRLLSGSNPTVVYD